MLSEIKHLESIL